MPTMTIYLSQEADFKSTISYDLIWTNATYRIVMTNNFYTGQAAN